MPLDVGGQNHADNLLPDRYEILIAEILEYVRVAAQQELERQAGMKVFQNGFIVVLNRKLVV